MSIKKPSRGLSPWKYLVGLWITGVLLGAFLYVRQAQGFAFGTSRIMLFHVPMAMMCVIAFWTSMVYAIYVLWRRELLADMKSECAAELGLLFGILATVAGSIFAAGNWGSFWNWDPKETCMLVLLMIYGAYFGLRSAVEDEERRAMLAAVYNIFAGVVMPFLVFVVPQIPALQSLHPKGVLTNTNRTSLDYKIVLYSGFIGYLGLYIWLFQLRLRVGILARAGETNDLTARVMVK